MYELTLYHAKFTSTFDTLYHAITPTPPTRCLTTILNLF